MIDSAIGKALGTITQEGDTIINNETTNVIENPKNMMELNQEIVLIWEAIDDIRNIINPEDDESDESDEDSEG